MADWKDKTKFKFVGRSGLRYRTEFHCLRPIDAVEKLVIEFYQAQGAVLNGKSNNGSLMFARGGRWKKYLVFSERRPRQIIAVSFSERPNSLAVTINYDVHFFYCLVIAPNALVTETRKLRALLEKQ